MNSAPGRSSRSIWIGFCLVLVTVIAIVISSILRSTVSKSSVLPVYSRMSDFHLTNQVGEVVSLASLQGKIWVGDVIFSRCAGPCPQMTKNMQALQSALEGDDSVMLVSLTTDPEFDTPEVLKRYGIRFEVDSSKWWFLTGTKEQIVRLAVDGLKLTAMETKPEERTSPEDLFIHSTLFVVVDRQGRLRAAIPGLESGWKAKTLEIIRAIRNEGGS